MYVSGADGVPDFIGAGASTDDELHALLQTVITRLIKMPMRRGVLIEEMGQTYAADPEADRAYCIAFGPGAGEGEGGEVASGPRRGWARGTGWGGRGWALRSGERRRQPPRRARGRYPRQA